MIYFCEYCSKEFEDADRRTRKRKFCSLRCSARYKTQHYKPEPNVICAYCNKKFYISVSRYKRSKNKIFFCCRHHKDLASRLESEIKIKPHFYGTNYKYKCFSNHEKSALFVGN